MPLLEVEKNIVKSAFSHVTYAETAVKDKIIAVSEVLLFQNSISSTIRVLNLKLPINRFVKI